MFMKSLNESSSLAISCLVMLGFGIPKISWASLVVAAAVDTSGGQNHNVGGTLDDAWSKNMLLRSLAILYCSLGQRGDHAHSGCMLGVWMREGVLLWKLAKGLLLSYQ